MLVRFQGTAPLHRLSRVTLLHATSSQENWAREMRIDVNDLSPEIQYRLNASTVVLRPITRVTTHSETTGDHAARFSFFNA